MCKGLGVMRYLLLRYACVCVFAVRKREAEDDRPVEPFIRGPVGLWPTSQHVPIRAWVKLRKDGLTSATSYFTKFTLHLDAASVDN